MIEKCKISLLHPGEKPIDCISVNNENIRKYDTYGEFEEDSASISDGIESGFSDILNTIFFKKGIHQIF